MWRGRAVPVQVPCRRRSRQMLDPRTIGTGPFRPVLIVRPVAVRCQTSDPLTACIRLSVAPRRCSLPRWSRWVSWPRRLKPPASTSAKSVASGPSMKVEARPSTTGPAPAITAALGSTPGVDANDPSWIKGIFFGSALNFGGDDFVSIPASNSLAPTKFTVSLWARAAAVPRPVQVPGRQGQQRLRLGLVRPLDLKRRRHRVLRLERQRDRPLRQHRLERIWDGRWHNVSATWDGYELEAVHRRREPGALAPYPSRPRSTTRTRPTAPPPSAATAAPATCCSRATSTRS